MISVSQATRLVRVVGERRVEDGVRDLVGDLVRVAFGDRLGGEEEGALSHGRQRSEATCALRRRASRGSRCACGRRAGSVSGATRCHERRREPRAAEGGQALERRQPLRDVEVRPVGGLARAGRRGASAETLRREPRARVVGDHRLAVEACRSRGRPARARRPVSETPSIVAGHAGRRVRREVGRRRARRAAFDACPPRSASRVGTGWSGRANTTASPGAACARSVDAQPEPLAAAAPRIDSPPNDARAVVHGRAATASSGHRAQRADAARSAPPPGVVRRDVGACRRVRYAVTVSPRSERTSISLRGRRWNQRASARCCFAWRTSVDRATLPREHRPAANASRGRGRRDRAPCRAACGRPGAQRRPPAYPPRSSTATCALPPLPVIARGAREQRLEPPALGQEVERSCARWPGRRRASNAYVHARRHLRRRRPRASPRCRTTTRAAPTRAGRAAGLTPAVGRRPISDASSSSSGMPLEHRADALRDRQLDADPPREVAQHRRRRQPLDDLADLRLRLLGGRAARDQLAGAAVAARRMPARDDQVAHARRARRTSPTRRRTPRRAAPSRRARA